MTTNAEEDRGREILPPSESWEVWDVWSWCPLTGALPNIVDINDSARMVGMIYRAREDFFSIYVGISADNGEEANYLQPDASVVATEARWLWCQRDQVVRRALGGVDSPRRYPGIADAWLETDQDDLESVLHHDAIAIITRWGDERAQQDAALRWPISKVLGVLAIGELATVRSA